MPFFNFVFSFFLEVLKKQQLLFDLKVKAETQAGKFALRPGPDRVNTLILLVKTPGC